jgi:hypothetical protein
MTSSTNDFEISIKNNNLIKLGYSGLYTNPSNPHFSSYIDYLMESVINDPKNISSWETTTTIIIRQFLYRLVFEADFSFSDKINS